MNKYILVLLLGFLPSINFVEAGPLRARASDDFGDSFSDTEFIRKGDYFYSHEKGPFIIEFQGKRTAVVTASTRGEIKLSIKVYEFEKEKKGFRGKLIAKNTDSDFLGLVPALVEWVPAETKLYIIWVQPDDSAKFGIRTNHRSSR